MNCAKCGDRLYGFKDVQFGRHAICPRRLRRKKEPLRIPRKGVDERATEARQFKEPDSVVYLDGRERLYGEDYRRRVREVLERDGYKCQWQRGITKGPCTRPNALGYIICGAPANNHPHHCIKRSKGRDDRAENLMAICDEHHKIAHPEKQVKWQTA